MNFSINTQNFSSAIQSLFVNKWLQVIIFLFSIIVYISFFLGGVTQTEGSIPSYQLTTATDSKLEFSFKLEFVENENPRRIKKGDTITALLGNYLSTQQILPHRSALQNFPDRRPI